MFSESVLYSVALANVNASLINASFNSIVRRTSPFPPLFPSTQSSLTTGTSVLDFLYAMNSAYGVLYSVSFTAS